jgi:hypothetical protein
MLKFLGFGFFYHREGLRLGFLFHFLCQHSIIETHIYRSKESSSSNPNNQLTLEFSKDEPIKEVQLHLKKEGF